MKLKYRLYALIIAAILPMVFFAGFAAMQLQDTLQRSAIQSIQATANATALMIDREIAASLASVRVLASSPPIEQRDWKRFYDFAIKSTAASGGWVVLYNQDGTQIINTRMAYGAALPDRKVAIKISDVLKHNSPQVSGLTWSPTLKKYVVLIDYPIRTLSGDQYVLSQAFFAEHFKVAVANKDMPKTWSAGIFDKDGLTLVRSLDANKLTGQSANPDTLAAIKKGGDVTLKHFIRGDVEVYDAITHSKLSGWAVAVGAPVDEIDGKLRRAGFIALTGLILALLTAIGVAAYIARGFVRSIRAAANAATAIGHGDSISTTDPTGIVELDALQEAIYQAGQELIAAKTGRQHAEDKNAQLLKSEQEARFRADSENRRKDEFLAMLSHELRNPLSAITSASSMLKIKAAAPEAMLKTAAVIQRQSDHLRKILDDLLDLSRVMYGKVTLEPTALELGNLIEYCVDIFKETGKLDAYVFSFHSEPLNIVGDATRIEQVFANVMVNALKYTPAGGSISVNVKADGDDALITIADTGVGIEPELMPYIFDVFVQGDQSIARTKGGMGVGLSLARKLVELHQGSINVRCDSVGQGCTFSIRFPMSIAPPEVRSNEIITAKTNAKYRILLVEDLDDGREMMAMLLTSMGHQVTMASNGEDALTAAQDLPDLVLSDVGLPEMDGYEVARRLRHDPKTAQLKLVALTGYGLAEDKRKAKDAGFDFHLTKPLRESEFQACLNHLFGT